uniref:AIG1-type G domain-containing protein n=1 Tax=Daphnia galeata TaxID=27404 RepID=A0A8J2RTH1_9CRUS|nr:unnamed protein product [Daphnia galeata]
MDKFKLPTMGRSVFLGDLYDNSRDKIISNGLPYAMKRKEIDLCQNGTAKSCVTILIDPSQEEKWALLKLNSHLQASIMANLLPSEDLWFSEYLFQEPSTENLHVACITVYLTAFNYHEFCDPQDITSSVKIKEFQSSLDRPTHVVSEIVHGFNALFSFELPTSSIEEKINVENQLYLWAKKTFSKLNGDFLPTDEQDSSDVSILTKASWYLLTDLKWGGFTEDDSFFTCLSALQKLIHCSDEACYVPVKIVLCSLESLKGNGPSNRDLEPDLISKLFSLKTTLLQVRSRCQFLLKNSFLTTIPHISFRLKEFQKCIQALDHYISCTISSTLIGYRRCGISKESVKKVCSEIFYNFFLDNMLMEWLIIRQQELCVLKSLLENIDIPWKTEELVIEDVKPGQHAKSFVFKTKLIEDHVITRLKKILFLDDSEDWWTTFEILEANQEDIEALRTKLVLFYENASKSYCLTILVTSYDLKDGTIQNFNRPFLSASNSASVSDQDDFVPLTSSDESSDLLVVSPLSFHSPKQIKNRSSTSSTYDHKDFDDVSASKTKSNFALEIETIGRNETEFFDRIYPDKSSLSLAQEFIRRCRCLQEGDPSIYLLKADEKESPNQEFRWFDIGEPSKGTISGHKIVILLGATGCGKSTIVNGIINYILGVEWNDPFRFCIINEAIQDEGLSQTTSVTAYTIHHMEGMKIPYDFTIIDTPGYGDIRGLERDREITRIIDRFLSHPETLKKFDFVSAVCFVASATDSRLTPTQQYILESVSNIFGSDIHNNLRLLITFSDDVKPPVLQAIRDACISRFTDEKDIPIQYHKFNNSVLYATNVPNLVEENEMYFDRVFWELGRSNFQSFLEKLAEMPEQNLDVAKQDVNSRIRFEKSLHDMELQLDIAFCKIENIEKFKQMVIHFRNEFESYRNYEIEVEEAIVIKIACRGSKWAYNCRNCSFSCEKSFSSKDRKEMEEHPSFPRPCCNKLCLCPGAMHGFDQFELEWAKVKVKKTLNNVKESYEILAGRKLSTEELLVECQQELYEAKLRGASLLEESLGVSDVNSKKTIVSDCIETLKSRARNSSRIQTLDELLRVITLQKNIPELVKADSLTNYSHSSASSERNETNSRDSSYLDIKNWGYHLFPKMFSNGD